MISKELFVKLMGEMKETYDWSMEYMDITGEEFVPDCLDAMIELLEEIFWDEEEWIDYFVYDLEFGADPSAKNLVDGDGDKVCLDNVERLYDFLLDNMLARAEEELFD